MQGLFVRFRWPTVMLAGWLLSSIAHAAIFDEVVVHQLNNGMPVILMENHKAPVVTFQVWYRAGARHDPWGKTGLAHVLEHMMFKGTAKVSGQAFTRIIQENGGQYNAFTSYDFAGYFATMASDRIAIVLDLEADRMQNLVMKEDEFETEKQVVMEERRLRVIDNPRALLSEQLNAAAFQAVPYHWPVIGWTDDLKRLRIEDGRRHYSTYYKPNNAFVVVVGDFEKDNMLRAVTAAFGAIPAGEKPEFYHFQDPPQKGERRVNVRTDARRPALLMGFHVPNIDHPDAYVLEVIAAVLSAGKSARLYDELVLKQELALSADAQNSLLSVDPDLFYLSAVPMTGIRVEDLEKALLAQLENLKNKPIDPGELRKAQNQLETDFVFSQDSLFYQAMLLARYEITAGWEKIKSYLPAIRQVSAEDIQRVATTYFVPENRTVAVLHAANATASDAAHGGDSRPSGNSNLGELNEQP